jgi:tRNA-(ms[2]io[6]A)-hydroxylase
VPKVLRNRCIPWYTPAALLESHAREGPMLCLRSRTEPAWLARAIANTEEILIDHAHCERKAATNALSLLARYPDRPVLVEPMLALAREELAHFEQVLGLLQARSVGMTMQKPSGYQARLFEQVRGGGDEKLVDLLLVAALIEARSCERFRLLAEHHPDEDLRAAFRSLLESEARHHAVFVRLAEEFQPREVVRARLEVLAEAERAVLESMPPIARIHA